MSDRGLVKDLRGSNQDLEEIKGQSWKDQVGEPEERGQKERKKRWNRRKWKVQPLFPAYSWEASWGKTISFLNTTVERGWEVLGLLGPIPEKETPFPKMEKLW